MKKLCYLAGSYFIIMYRELIRCLVRILFIFPIKKNSILFESFYGKAVSDNPMYIMNYLKDDAKMDYEYIWSIKEFPEKMKGVKYIKYKSLKWLYYQCVAKVIVSNCRPDIYIPKRKGQIFIETWHGGGAYKIVGREAHNYNKSKIRVTKWRERAECSKIDYFLASSKMNAEYGIVRAFNYHGNIVNCGSPRNDIFFDNKQYTYIRAKVREKYNIHGLTILYAPTWRSAGSNKRGNSEHLLDISSVNKYLDKHQIDHTILYRAHVTVCNKNNSFQNIIDLTSYPDMQELLCATDILITDYSSSIWDYALTEKPCLLYVPDLDDFENNQGGTILPVSKWPGIPCINIETLCDAIKNMKFYDFAKIAGEHLNLLESYENGNACKQVAEIIYRVMN
ncbi:MAG: CDP-glycerol glycerophosphotransferase family protein [bacterium]|nr:CDP-glycerol glycerophosphotransferase family protein [bacterium]